MDRWVGQAQGCCKEDTQQGEGACTDLNVKKESRVILKFCVDADRVVGEGGRGGGVGGRTCLHSHPPLMCPNDRKNCRDR